MASVASMPTTLINFEVFDNANRLIGLSDIELPDVKMLTTELQGAGIAGKMDFPVLGFVDSVEITFNWRTLTDQNLVFLAMHSYDFICYGAIEHYKTASGEIKAVQCKINTRVVPKGLTAGNMKPADSMETKSTFEVIYYKNEINKVTRVEFDKFNYKFLVDGFDYLAEVRTILNI